jgi:hypothetical protein
MTSLFDVMCAAQLRNVRLSDGRPIRTNMTNLTAVGVPKRSKSALFSPCESMAKTELLLPP